MAEIDIPTKPPRRRVVRSKQTPLPFDDAANAPESGATPQTSGTPMLTKMFVACLVFGAMLALLSLVKNPLIRTVGVLGPIGATAFYPFWGAAQGVHRKASLRERFSDNCYYLGFIFTQWALVVGFLPVALFNQEITSHDVLRLFSVALGASLVGLVARTFFIQTGHTVSESADIVEGEVDALARLVSDKSRKVLGEFEALSAKLGQSYTKLGENLDASADALERTMHRFDTALKADLGILEREGGSIGEATAAAASAVAGQQFDFAEKIRAAAQSIEGLRAGLLAQGAQAGLAITETAQSLRTGLHALQDVSALADSVKTIDGRLGDITAQMSKVGETIETATRNVEGKAAQALETAEGAIGRRETEVLSQAQALGGDLAAAVASLQGTLTAFRAEMERIRV